MAILFRPFLPIDKTHWIPLLQQELKDLDFRVWPDIGDPADITYYMGWEVFEGDIDAYPNLRAFLSLRAGVERFIGNPNFPRNAKLIRMIDPGLTESMVEYVISYVMRFHREHDKMPEYLEPPWGRLLPKRAGATSVGLMGMGHIGQSCAQKLVSLGFHVQGWSQSKKNIDGVKSFAGHSELDTFLSSTDILVCILPLTPQTSGILNKDLFYKLPKGAAIINVARGKHLIEEDLVSAIQGGQIGIAALDVFRKEPLPKDHPFQNIDRILTTPHIAGITSPDTAVPVMRKTITDIEAGHLPDGLVDIEKGY